MSKRTLILASLLAVMWLPMGCVIVVDGNGDMDAGWASSWEAERDVQVEVKAPVGGLHRNSLVLLNQIQTIDKRPVA